MSLSVRCYFDFVSPYSWLALEAMPAFAERHGIRFLMRPVLYAALLDATGLIGPVETEAKRAYTFADIRRCAALHGLPLTGPPEHPFRSLPALRLACLFADHAEALDLSVRLARAAWSDGADLTSAAVLASVARTLGLPVDDLGNRVAAPDLKQRLRRFTDEALGLGVFGVPTFELDGELFWGHDRLEHLAARCTGVLADPRPGLSTMLARPRGAVRVRAPGGER